MCAESKRQRRAWIGTSTSGSLLITDQVDSECNAQKDAHAQRLSDNPDTCFHHLNHRQQAWHGDGKVFVGT